MAVPFSRGSSQPRDRIQQLQISENSGTEIQSPWKLCHCRPGGDLYYCPSPKFQNMRANFMSKTASDWVEPVINRLQWGRPGFNPWIGKIPWRREWQPTVGFLPGESHGQRNLGAYSPWGWRVRHNWATKQSTIINIYSEKAMAAHSSTLAWKIPWAEEPDRLQSMGSLRVGHDWVTSLSLFTFMHWRRKWQPTPVFLPGESQGRESLVGCCLWGRTESDTTEAT